jgi:hypothetical protein
MSPAPFRYDASVIDLGPRIFTTTAVTGSPALAAETIVATITTSGDIAASKGAHILWALAWTVGTNGVSARYRVRRTDASGTTVYDSGVTTAGIAATALLHASGYAFDSGPTLPGQVYVVTLTVGSGSAASTVSAAHAACLLV